VELNVQLDPQHLERLTAATPLTGVMELIWNALDADAEEVEVTLVRNPLDGIEEIRVKDDGHGMTFEEASATFGKLGGSWKKSEAAKRTIPLLAILRDFLDEQLGRTGRAGTDHIFGRAADQVFYPSTIDGRARRAWKAYNLAEREAAEEEGRAPVLLTLLTLHECRHTFASLLIDTGANPKAIQMVMGHSKIQTTFDVYGHLLPGSYDDVRVRMDAYLAKGRGDVLAEVR
jgi:integrase